MWPANLEAHLKGDLHRKRMQLPSFQRVPGYQPPAEKNMVRPGIQGMLNWVAHLRARHQAEAHDLIRREHASFVVTAEEKTKMAALRV